MISFFFTFFMLTTLAFCQTPNCLSPFNFKQESRCVQTCEENYVLLQGTDNCQIIDDNCKMSAYLENNQVTQKPFCDNTDSVNTNNMGFTLIKSEQSCNERQIKNFITGQCESEDQVDKRGYKLIGIYNPDKSAIILESYLKVLLSQKGGSRVFPGFSDQASLKCEVIDFKNRICISRANCKENQNHIDDIECVPLCPKGKIPTDQECIACDQQNNSNCKQLIQYDKYYDTKGPIDECNDNIFFDFDAGIMRCNPTGQQKHMMLSIWYPVECLSQCFKFCTLNKELLELQKANKLKYGERFLDSCTEQHDTIMGLFRIRKIDCPFYVRHNKNQKYCVNTCRKNEKVIITNSNRECIDCQRMSVEGNGCSDSCLLTEKKISFSDQCTNIESGLFSFDYNVEKKQFSCNYPRMLSKDGSSCVYKCPQDEIPSQDKDSKQLSCIDKTDTKISQEIEGYLSSDKTRYVEDCTLIHEIRCPNSKNKCFQRKLNSTTLRYQSKGCYESVSSIIQNIGNNIDKIKNIFQYEQVNFMIKELNDFFTFFGKPSIHEYIQGLKKMTYYSMLLSQHYAHFNEDGDVDLYLVDPQKNVTVAIVVIPYKGGNFQRIINFTQLFNNKKRILINHQDRTIQVLSLLLFNEYSYCETKSNCIDISFIIFQKIMGEGIKDEEKQFEVVFDLNYKQKIDLNDKELECYCLSGTLDKDSFSIRLLRKQIAKVFDTKNNQKSVICQGDDFVGYHVGKYSKNFTNFFGKIEMDEPYSGIFSDLEKNTNSLNDPNLVIDPNQVKEPNLEDNNENLTKDPNSQSSISSQERANEESKINSTKDTGQGDDSNSMKDPSQSSSTSSQKGESELNKTDSAKGKGKQNDINTTKGPDQQKKADSSNWIQTALIIAIIIVFFLSLIVYLIIRYCKSHQNPKQNQIGSKPFKANLVK